MTRDLILHGRRLDSPHSKTRESTLTILHLNEWPAPVDFDAEGRRLLLFLVNNLPPATMDALELDRDLAREVERLRAENDRLQKLNDSMEKIIGECRCAATATKNGKDRAR